MKKNYNLKFSFQKKMIKKFFQNLFILEIAKKNQLLITETFSYNFFIKKIEKYKKYIYLIISFYTK